jgi:uncharacterized protein with HEPN domain
MRERDDSVAALLSDIAQLVDDGMRIVARGKTPFFDHTDRTQRLAAKAIVIDLNSAAERLPEDFRLRYPDVAWAELRAMRNYLAHDYANTDYFIIWNALARDFPALRIQLGADAR